MRRIALTMLLGLVAFTVAAAIARSRGQHQIERYLGSSGWTLKRNVVLTLPDKEPRIIGREELFFSADGRRRKIAYRIDNNGTETKETCEQVTTFIPGRGVFHEISHDQRLMYVAHYEGFGGDVNVSNVRAGDAYSGDVLVLGYPCALKRTILPDGGVEESYEGYNFANYPLKMVSRNSERTQTWEPTSIEIGNVPESALVHHKEWAVDFTLFERQIQRVQFANLSDSIQAQQIQAQQAKSLRQTLEQAKQQLSAQGYTIK